MDTAVLDLIHDEPHMIGRWLGFDDLSDLHGQWIRDMVFAEEDKTLLSHRGSYKTTCLTIALAIILSVFPDRNNIMLRKTDDDVKEIVSQVSKILRSEVMQNLSYRLRGKGFTLIEDTAFRISTDLTTTKKGASQLLGLGCKSSITGKHADNIMTDDIVNLRDRISRPERDLVKLSYKELQNIKNRKGGRIYNTGTPWHKDDAISLMPNVQRFDCYETGMISRKELEKLRHDLGNSLFAANYELKHIADEDCMFSEPTFTDDETLVYGGICHVDAAYGGSDGTAFTALRATKEGKMYVFGKRWDKHVDDCLTDIMAFREMYKLGSVSCENNADKGYLAKELKGLGCPVSTYHETTNKFVKISTYLRKSWANIEFLEDTDPEYINEILDYNEYAEHDDAPDSLACLIRQVANIKKWVY